MQLHSTQPIEEALAEFIAAAFSPEEREIARLKAKLAALKPHARGREFLCQEICDVRLRQLRKELT